MRKRLEKLATGMKQNIAEIVVVVLCLAVLGFFVSEKEGFHMDEMLSYELANAEFNPWIVPTQPEGRLAKFVHNEIDGATFGETLANLTAEVKDVLQNRGSSKLLNYTADVYQEPVWITAEQFRDYIAVEQGDAFNYLSVYFNVKDDNHPPLHFMLLHTMSSIFQGRADAWMGCLLNLVVMGAILVLLIKIGRRLAVTFDMEEKSRWMGLACALFYGISAGAVATTLLIRMYGLLTLWCVAFFYLILKKWQEKDFERRNLGLIFVTALGFWTQYFFLFYCILLAVVVTVCLLRGRRMRELWGFVRSMVIAAVLGVAVFPFAIQDVFSSGRGVEALDNLAEGFSGYGQRLAAFTEIMWDRTLAPLFFVWVIVFGFGLLLRRVKAGKGNAISLSVEEKMVRRGRFSLLWMLFLPVAGYFLLAARMAPYLVDRYVMPMFPFVILLGTLLLFTLVSKSEKYGVWGVKGATLPVVCLCVLYLQGCAVMDYDGEYLYRGYAAQEAVAEEYAEYSCLCIYTGVSYYENLREFTNYEETLLLTAEELENRTDRESLETQGNLVVLIKEGVDEIQVLERLESDYGFTLLETKMMDDGVYEDSIYLMGKDS